MIKTLPTLVRTRQCFDLHFLLIRLKIDLRMWFFRRAALGRTNLLFRPNNNRIFSIIRCQLFKEIFIGGDPVSLFALMLLGVELAKLSPGTI